MIAPPKSTLLSFWRVVSEVLFLGNFIFVQIRKVEAIIRGICIPKDQRQPKVSATRPPSGAPRARPVEKAPFMYAW
jgi:hypothetical protein